MRLFARSRAAAQLVPNTVSASRLAAYRASTFRLAGRRRLRSAEDAVSYVNERGFVYFWPIKGADLPSLWVAVAGERPVADRHDDPGHVTWGWKDQMLGQRRWFYAKVLRGRATMIALHVLPYFYALSENYGDPDDYLLEYESGRMSQEARQVYEALAEQGPLDSLALRREARLAGRESAGRFDRALVDLQRGFRVLPTGVAKAGRWKYAFIYDLVSRHHPEVAAAARQVGRGEARQRLLDLYLQSVGASTPRPIASLFGWQPAEVQKAIEGLVSGGRAFRPAEVGRRAGAWVATTALRG